MHVKVHVRIFKGLEKKKSCMKNKLLVEIFLFIGLIYIWGKTLQNALSLRMIVTADYTTCHYVLKVFESFPVATKNSTLLRE